MYCFWKAASKGDNRLLGALEDAHALSAHRENLSTQAVLACATAGIGYTQALSAALLTLGGTHAPITQAIRTLNRDTLIKEIPEVLSKGHRIAGWGNSFVKGHPDPLWEAVDTELASFDKSLHNRIVAITKAIHEHGPKIYPNPACYTAAVAIVTEMPINVAAYLFVAPRLMAWTELYEKATR